MEERVPVWISPPILFSCISFLKGWAGCSYRSSSRTLLKLENQQTCYLQRFLRVTVELYIILEKKDEIAVFVDAGSADGNMRL